jgi:hypothetical protein
MSAKEVRFSVDARDRMLHGIDTLAALVQLLQGVEAGADAVPVPKASGKWPGDDDLIADIFVDRTAMRHNRFRDSADCSSLRMMFSTSSPT